MPGPSTQERKRMSFEIRTWAKESNDMLAKENEPSLIVRIADSYGKTVWHTRWIAPVVAA